MSKAQAAFANALRAECGGRALGPTLEALLALAPGFDYLVVDPREVDAARRRDHRDRLGIVTIGRASDGYFGPIADQLVEPIDASPIGYADRQGLDPAVVGKDLASFLGVWAFVPDFFELGGRSAKDIDTEHLEFFGELAEEELADIRAVAELPGVASLTSGADVVRALAAAPQVSFVPKRGTPTDIQARADALFCAAVGDAKLLVDLETIDVESDELVVTISVNAPPELAPKVVAHRAVDAPLRAFRSELRAAYPEKRVRLAFVAVPTGERSDALRSLSLALRHAKATDLLAELDGAP